MIKGKNFVFTGLQPWDITIGSNAKDIALEVSKQNKVLYINTPLDLKTYRSKESTPETVQRKKVIEGKLPPLRQINANMWVLDYPFTIWPVNLLPDGFLFDLVNRFNNNKMYTFVRDILKEIQFDEYYLFTDNDIYRSFYAKDILKPELSIYYRRDNLLPMDFWRKHAPRLEPLLIKKYDLVLCNSIQLAQYASQYNKRSYDVGQGVDLSQYKSDFIDEPNDIKAIKRPIVGYIGNITSLRLDVNLVYNLALQNPNISFVLVGKSDAVFSRHTLKDLTNVHFLGMKPEKEVPMYIHSFDICLNPQIINEITIGNYPRKIDEFLAFGKPVIATSTNTMQIFKHYVYLCTTIKDYQQAIELALVEDDNNTVEKRIKFANSHTWKNSVDKIYQYINSIITQ